MLFAVDIALLADARTRDLVVPWNARLREHRDGSIRLDAKERPGFGLPHLTLAIGVVDGDDIARIATGIATIGSQNEARARAVGIGTSRHAGRQVASLEFDRDGLLPLHEAVMAWGREAFVSQPASPEHFVETDLDAPHEATVEYVTRFEELAGHERFRPHVTIGFGSPAEFGGEAWTPGEDLGFDALAICRLGASCTCRRVLWRSDS